MGPTKRLRDPRRRRRPRHGESADRRRIDAGVANRVKTSHPADSAGGFERFPIRDPRCALPDAERHSPDQNGSYPAVVEWRRHVPLVRSNLHTHSLSLFLPFLPLAVSFSLVRRWALVRRWGEGEGTEELFSRTAMCFRVAS